ncbi:thiolase-like protein [Tribonema minus]|uniref:3-oxoacyl-[acyl-carrier-protein] synthase n=1 Tax=Tribonema minus TaxID=303371 RepID=A0A835Z6H3_9STRA|nr:thiolase-like protein [Tribonema minus]
MRPATLLCACLCGHAYAFLPPLSGTKLPNAQRYSQPRSAVRMAAEVDPKKRVVVTGMGVVSGCGKDADSFWEFLLAGKSSIARVEAFDVSEYKCQIGSEVRDFTAADYFTDKKSAKSNDRVTHFAMAAARLAIDDAGIDIRACGDRAGVMVGSAFGGMDTFEKQVLKLASSGPSKVSPFTIPALLGNTASGVIAIETGAKGPNFGLVSACATATHCIGESLKTIRAGEADVMIAGGAEAAITPLSYAGFCSLKAMATGYNDDPQRASRPFDKDRAGFVMAEGGGVLILESLEHAQKRGAKIYAELAGYGASGDAHHITSPAPDGAGLADAFERCLKSAGCDDKAQVTYINAHGTSTAYNDKFETMAIKRCFGEEGAKALYVSSTKGATGHALGAAGGLEAVACCKAIQTSTLPPTINYQTPDLENGLDLNYVPNKPITLDTVTGAISDNLGFGGHNAAIFFKKLE